MSTRHRTQVCTSRQFEAEWARLIDELARRGVLGTVGAADALLGIAGELADPADHVQADHDPADHDPAGRGAL